MTTKRAFVLSGGASEGAVQVGMLKALTEAGVEPDLIVGSSVGAINGAVIAGAPGKVGVSRLEEIWRGIRRADVFPLTPIVGFLGFIGRRDHLVANHALRRLISANVAFPRLEEFPTPLAVMTTDLVTGRDIPLTSGPSVTALLASAAIPGVFPPVAVDGRPLVDGGVGNNTPVSHAVDMGADEVYVLPAGHVCDREEAPDTAIGTLLRSLTIMLGTRLAIAIQRYEKQVRLKVVPPPCPSDVSPIDFSQTDTLIDAGYETARTWLTSEPPVTGQAHLAAPAQRAPQ
ncbi:MAG: patatin-like phospholipase family protein [Acidimicrobiia bacterium]|nr:patatin-like phospholipase family protein [Acidimicrobiia bacterium]